MPAIQPQSSTVLLTGASAFIGSHVVKELISRGFSVVGTTRSDDKGEYLKNLFGDKFSYVIVKDLEDEGGFDEAVKDKDAIIHIASPFHMNVQDPEKDLINPAVNGTTSLMNSAVKNGNKVKRVVITSSFASIVTPQDVPFTYDESQWNTSSPAIYAEKGKDTPAQEVYRTSKVKAEEAAWKLLKEHKPAFDLVTMCPPLVLGPIIHQVPKADSLNTSVAMHRAYLTGQKKVEEMQGFGGFEVDVRDLAFAHVEALVQEEAGNKRFGISNAAYSMQECLDILHSSQDPEVKEALKKHYKETPVGKTGSYKDVKMNKFDASRSEKILGVKYRDIKTTIEDQTKALAAREDEWAKA